MSNEQQKQCLQDPLQFKIIANWKNTNFKKLTEVSSRKYTFQPNLDSGIAHIPNHMHTELGSDRKILRTHIPAHKPWRCPKPMKKEKHVQILPKCACGGKIFKINLWETEAMEEYPIEMVRTTSQNKCNGGPPSQFEKPRTQKCLKFMPFWVIGSSSNVYLTDSAIILSPYSLILKIWRFKGNKTLQNKKLHVLQNIAVFRPASPVK